MLLGRAGARRELDECGMLLSRFSNDTASAQTPCKTLLTVYTTATSPYFVRTLKVLLSTLFITRCSRYGLHRVSSVRAGQSNELH
jgi:hypothetical protein